MGARWMGARWMGARWMGARWMELWAPPGHAAPFSGFDRGPDLVDVLRLVARSPHASPHWFSRFARRDIYDGELFRQAKAGALGATATWAQVEPGISEDEAYAAEIARHARGEAHAVDILDRIREDDVRWALDALRGAGPPLRWVVVEPVPWTLDDPVELYKTAVDLAKRIDRAGVALALPATPAGFEVGAVLLGEGRSVAFDPILTPGALEAAVAAHHRGVETCKRIGLDPRAVAALAFVPVDRLPELADEAGAERAPTMDEAVRALDLAWEGIDVHATEDGSPFLLIGPGFGHGVWVRDADHAERAAPTGDGFPWSEDAARRFQTAALAERATRARVAHARLLELLEERRCQALADVLGTLEVEPSSVRVAAQALAQTWSGDVDAVATRMSEGLGLLDLFEDLQEQLLDAEVEEVLWVAPRRELASVRAWLEAHAHIDGYPELVLAEPEGVVAALQPLADASVVVVSGLTDDREAARATRRALEVVESERMIVLVRPGSSLDRLSRERACLAVLEPLLDDATACDCFSLTTVLPAVLAGADIPPLAAELDALLGSAVPELPPSAHAGVRLAAALRAFVDAGGEALEVVTSPSLAGFRAWLAAQDALEALGLAVSEVGDGRVVLYVEGEPGFEVPPEDADLTLTVRLSRRRQIVQEMLRWTMALELALSMGDFEDALD